MVWILICAIWVHVISEAFWHLDKMPLASHYLWGRVLRGIIGLPTWALLLYGLCFRPLYLMYRKAATGNTWLYALGSHCLELGFFLFVVVPMVAIKSDFLDYWPGLVAAAVLRFIVWAGDVNERTLDGVIKRHAPRLQYKSPPPARPGPPPTRSKPQNLRWTFNREENPWQSRNHKAKEKAGSRRAS